ncbi:GNAT family N-acetyltransferase [archaeon]|nr:MAG: GNAT family N-acetyltransferase [archaeon]
MGPRGSSSGSGPGGLPDILVIVQVAFEGKISAKSLQADLDRGHKASGDLIPWVVSTQYNEPSFAGLSGGELI